MFEDFKDTFSECEEKTLQPAILNSLAAYIGKSGKFDKYGTAQEKFLLFYKQVEKDTGQSMGQQSATRKKTLQELNPKYYDDSINSRFREGTYNPDFALACFFWLHCLANEYAKSIHSLLHEEYPHLEKYLADLDKDNAFKEIQAPSNDLNSRSLASQRNNQTKNWPFKTIFVYFKKLFAIINTKLDTIIDKLSNTPPSFTEQFRYTAPSTLKPLFKENGNPVPIEAFLNPNEQYRLPLFEREEELRQLDEFANDISPFKIWVVIGPSGSGKTKLVNSWLTQKKSAIAAWDKFVLKGKYIDFEPWGNWRPQKNTIIVIDYLFGFTEIIEEIIRAQNRIPNNLKVRLLVINHVFPEGVKPDDFSPLFRDPEWNFSKSSFLNNDTFYNNCKPLDLTKTDKQFKIMYRTLRLISGDKLSHRTRLNALKHLKFKMSGAWQPLFAGLMGDSLKKNEMNFESWNRKELIYRYFSRKEYKLWDKTKESNSRERILASYFIAAATARREATFSKLHHCLKDVDKPNLKVTKSICNRIVTSSHQTILLPFEPDILGETFFLLFLENGLSNHSSFFRMLESGNSYEQINAAIGFVGFIERLVRNLGNEIQTDNDIKNFWNILKEFLVSLILYKNDKTSNNTSYLGWAASVALFNIYESRKHHDLDYANDCINHINPSFIYDEKNFYLVNNSIDVAIKYFEALQSASKYLINSLLRYAIRIESVQKEVDQATPVMWASILNCCYCLETLLDNNFKINSFDKDQRTALIYSSIEGHSNIVELLLKRGARVNHQDKYGQTSIIWACVKGHKTVVCLLIEHGANINQPDAYKQTPLLMASALGSYDILHILVSHGAKINSKNILKQTSLMLASIESHLPVIELLISQPEIKINNSDIKGMTALMMAASKNNHDAVDILMSNNKTRINLTDRNGLTALIHASSRGHLQATKSLTNNKKILIDKATYEQWTPLIVASAANGHFVVEHLLDKGANVNHEDKNKQTALIWAAKRGHIKATETLLKNGSMIIDHQDIFKSTALIYACQNGHLSIVRLLLNKGAKQDIESNEGFTAIVYAFLKGHIKIVALLSLHRKGLDFVE